MAILVLNQSPLSMIFAIVRESRDFSQAEKERTACKAE